MTNKWIIFLIFSLYNTSSIAKECHLYKIVDIIKCVEKNCEVKLSNNKIINKINPIIGSLVESCVESIVEKKKEGTKAELPPIVEKLEQVVEPPQEKKDTGLVEQAPIKEEIITPEAKIEPITVQQPTVVKENKISNCRKQRITGVSNCINRKTCFAWLEDGNYIEHRYPVYIGDVVESCDFN